MTRWSWPVLLAALALGSVLVGPVAAGLSVEIQPPRLAALDGTPMEARVHLSHAPAEALEVKAWLGGPGWQASRTWNGTAWQRSDWYALEVRPGPDGTWEGWIGLQANPSSNRYEQLAAQGNATIGVRVRGPGLLQEAMAETMGVVRPTLVPVAAGPGQAVEVQDQGLVHRQTNHADDARILDVVLPTDRSATVCLADRCRPASGARLAAVAEELVVLENPTDRRLETDGMVLELPGGRCPVGQALAPGSRTWIVTPEAGDLPVPEGSVACDPSGPGGRTGRLWDLGRVLDEQAAPTWGWMARLPDRPGAWTPHPLPPGTWPEPVRSLDVQGHGRAFATQEAGLASVLQVIGGADQRLTVATYLLTNTVVADALEQALGRGVEVRLILEPTPVGGMPEYQEHLVDRLEAAGAEVIWASLPGRGLMHAKVIVADGHVVLVLTENLTNSGLPADHDGNVGWGIGLANRTLAARLEGLFGVQGPARAWTPAGWGPVAASVAVLTTPENTWRREGVVAAIEGSDGPIDGLVLGAQTAWGTQANPWLEALVEASDRWPVRLLFNGVGGQGRPDLSNQPARAHLLAHPEAGDLEVRLSTPAQGKVHAKGLVGPDWALIGSSNWGSGGAVVNREVNLLVRDPGIAQVYRRAFEEAWEQGMEPAVAIPGAGPGVGLAVGLAAVLVAKGRGKRAGATVRGQQSA